MRLMLRRVRQLQRLAVFEAVGRLGSFTAAAEELGLTQPAVSKQMRALEESLRTGLFDRHTNRRTLTGDGTALHEAVTEAFDLLETRLALLRGESGQLRIAVQPSVAESWFASRLAELRETMAPTHVHLVIFDQDRELPAIDHDVSIRFGTGGLPHLRSTQLVPETVVPVASPDLAERLGLTPESPAEALLKAPLLHVDATGRQWQQWSTWFARKGITYDTHEQAVVYPTYGSVVPLAISGNGVILSWRTLIGDHLERGLLTEVGPAITIPAHGYYLYWPPSLTHDTALQRFRTWLVATVADRA